MEINNKDANSRNKEVYDWNVLDGADMKRQIFKTADVSKQYAECNTFCSIDALYMQSTLSHIYGKIFCNKNACVNYQPSVNARRSVKAKANVM